MADGPIPPPMCDVCGGRHWFLEPCGGQALGITEEVGAKLDPPPTPAEIVKAVRYYRRHLAREKDRSRARRSPVPRETTSGVARETDPL